MNVWNTFVWADTNIAQHSHTTDAACREFAVHDWQFEEEVELHFS